MSSVCPICKEVYNERPAMSRKVEGLNICPICGAKEAVEFLPKAEQERIIQTVEASYRERRRQSV